MPDPMPLPLLTRARRSVWSAIENWAALEGAFRRVWKFEDNGALPETIEPSIGDLPALAIYPSLPGPSEWVLNQSRRLLYPLEARLWTRHWNLLAGEALWEEIAKALFQSAPLGQPTYLFLGTGTTGVALGPLAARRERLGPGGPPCTVWQWSIGLEIHWNPAL